MNRDAHRCSYLAGLLGDPLTATATEASAWLLVEHPGPWGKDALADSGVAPDVVAELRRRGAATGVRVQLVSPPQGAPARHCLVAADPRPGRPWLAALPCDGVPSVLDLDFAALAGGQPPSGAEPVADPLYVVCANDRSDPCCGRTGPAVHAALRERLGDRCRRTAHVGGHKYAANLVAFPYGLFYGRLEPHSARDVVAAHDSGQVHLDRYRGRSGYTLAEQAAEHFLRRDTAATGLDEVTLVRGARVLADDTYVTTFAVSGRAYDVVVGAHRRHPPRVQSCSDSGPTLPVEWRLDRMAPVPDAEPPGTQPRAVPAAVPDAVHGAVPGAVPDGVSGASGVVR